MKKIKILFLSLFVLAACSKDDDDNGTAKSSAKAITTFVFTAAENDALSADVKAAIDEDKKTISAEFPAGTAVTSLKPSITISEDAKVTPGDKEAKDFSEAVAYTVTAEDGTEVKYTVTVTIGKSNAKEIISFVFTAADNETLSEDVKAEIDEEAKTITAEMPFGTDVTALKPVIEISEKAGAAPGIKETVDFSEAVTYKIMAEDGSEVEYVVSILLTEPTDRQVLIEFFNANPDNEFGWDLEETDIATWSGVTLDDNGKLMKLNLALDSLPTAIGHLKNLRELDLSSSSLASLPPEIGNLTNLGKLFLVIGSLTSLPPEIGNLTNLEELVLDQNSLTSLPSEIGNLINLKKLTLSENSLTSVPPEIGNLTNLEDLHLWGNSLTSVPPEIGNLTNLEELRLDFNSLTSLPSDIGKLANLENLHLNSNSLTSLPSDIGKLTKLNLLWIESNKITSIPKEICDLFIRNFSKDATAECEQ